MKIMSVIIVDNFLDDPFAVRKWVLNQSFYDSKQFTEMYGSFTDWPGKRTEHVYDLNNSYGDYVLNKVANYCNIFFGIKNLSIKSYFQLTTLEDGDSWVHQDNNVDVAGILYLNPDPPQNSGTTLYKCKNISKWESYMSDSEGYDTLKTINRYQNSSLYSELFEPVDVIGNVFNRLIMYEGKQYHKSNDYFGDSLNDGRLTQVFFIKQE